VDRSSSAQATYSFTVMTILIVLVGIVTIARMSTDIFPDINIPVVTVIWSYPGVAPEVKFLPVDENAPIVVPANTLLFRAQGPQVATITRRIEFMAGNSDRSRFRQHKSK
jgi:Cu/Ag efflux pump CusA